MLLHNAPSGGLTGADEVEQEMWKSFPAMVKMIFWQVGCSSIEQQTDQWRHTGSRGEKYTDFQGSIQDVLAPRSSPSWWLPVGTRPRPESTRGISAFRSRLTPAFLWVVVEAGYACLHIFPPSLCFSRVILRPNPSCARVSNTNQKERSNVPWTKPHAVEQACG